MIEAIIEAFLFDYEQNPLLTHFNDNGSLAAGFLS